MRKKISIELFEEGENANVYSYRVNDEDLEFEKFIISFMDSDYASDYDIVDDTIDRILKNGAQERYFRPEGKIIDYLFAIPQKGLNCELRLFCLRVSEKVVILGNGGIKKKNEKKYQDNPILNGIAIEMQNICSKLKKDIGDSSTVIFEKEFIQINKIII